MVRLLDDQTTAKQQIAETYSRTDNWDRVEQYGEAMRWKAAHPQQGSYVASQALELPRGRIRTWFEGGKPDAMHAIETAESQGWLDAAPGDRIFEGLSVLHAWILAGGSISKETYLPSFAVGPSDPTELAYAAFAAIGLPTQTINDTSTKRAREIRPKGQGRSHLGRFLYGVFNAPVGEKTQVGADPLRYLGSVPRMTLLRWCRTYTTLRGTSIELAQGKRIVRIGEKRSQEYREALGEVFRDGVDDDTQITVGEGPIVLREDAVDLLDQVPTLPQPS